MSSSRPVHQDYIARIRYTNALPPPPFAPKLLEIANASIASGQYTSASFASRLAREQPLNVDADAELGMGIDLVGLKGALDGNDLPEYMMLPEHPPPIDPADRPLLKPLSTAGRSGTNANNVSFLRRTEYITSHRNTKDDAGGVLRSNSALRQPNRRPGPKTPEPAKNTPEAMIRGIEKSFALAYPHDAAKGPDGRLRAEISRADREAWERPRHPTQPELTVVDSYPIVPDISALGDAGVYMLLKYHNNPTGLTTHYDERLDVALLQPLQPTQQQINQYEDQLELYNKDPIKYNKPTYFTNFNLFIPDGDAAESVPSIKRKFNVYAEDRDDDALYTHQPGIDEGVAEPCFRYSSIRFYETYQQAGHSEDPWNDSVAIALHDGENRGQKAAYAYPITQKTFIRLDRSKIKKQRDKRDPRPLSPQREDGEVIVHAMDVEIRDPLPEEKEKIASNARALDPTIHA